MTRRVLITGASGQDGAWLARQLVEAGDTVFAAHRRTAGAPWARLEALGVADRVQTLLLDLAEPTNVLRALERAAPDEVYHLAAQSDVAVSFEQPSYTLDVNATGTARLLDALRTVCPGARLYHASTSEMFGSAGDDDRALDETSPLQPRSPYAIAKVAAHHLVGLYRDAHGLHACRGVLFNHESHLRGPDFVTRKLSLAAVRIAAGRQAEVTLGNLDARRDWGFAPEYVDAMVRMLRHPTPDDYVVATGRATTVRAFATWCFAAAGLALTWEGEGVDEVGREAATGVVRVRVDPRWHRPADVGCLRGDASKASRVLGWRAQTFAEALADRMVAADRDALQITSGPGRS